MCVCVCVRHCVQYPQRLEEGAGFYQAEIKDIISHKI